MAPTRAVTVAPGEGPAYWFFGRLIVVKSSSEETGGAVCLSEQWFPRGVATPVHAQPADFEAFYVIQGEMTFFVGEAQERVEARAGSYAFIPPGAPHAFVVRSETAGVLNYTTPNHEGFFYALAEPAPARELPPPGPPDMEKVAQAADRFGVEILGPPPE